MAKKNAITKATCDTKQTFAELLSRDPELSALRANHARKSATKRRTAAEWAYDALHNEIPAHSVFLSSRHVTEGCPFAIPFTVFRHISLSTDRTVSSQEFLGSAKPTPFEMCNVCFRWARARADLEINNGELHLPTPVLCGLWVLRFRKMADWIEHFRRR